jgi:hypothetical protein
MFQESTYSFLQESQIDIESPHMDPAVVAVSSFIPPPISQTTNIQRSAFANSIMPEDMGVNDRTLRAQVDKLRIDADIAAWKDVSSLMKGESTTKLMNSDLKGDSYNNGKYAIQRVRAY